MKSSLFSDVLMAPCFVILCSTQIGRSQERILHDPVSSRTFTAGTYSEVKGSPLLFEDWRYGSATTDKGVYTNLSLKLDVYKNVLYFKRAEEAFEFEDPVKSFTLCTDGNDTGTCLRFKRNTVVALVRQGQFMRILAEGEINFYRIDKKMLFEANEINNGVVKKFSDAKSYVVRKGNEDRWVKDLRKDLLPFVADKAVEVENFIKERKLKLAGEEDAVKIVRYYNQIAVLHE